MDTNSTLPSHTLSGYWRQFGQDQRRASAEPRRQTKIVCTLGPASSAPAMVIELAWAGMDVARLNFSHGTHHDHQAAFEAVRAASEAVGRPLAVLADLCGPKIRVCGLDEPRTVDAGESVVLCGRGEGAEGDLEISFSGLAECLAAGDPVLIDDGMVRLVVRGAEGSRVLCQVEVGGRILPNKGVNLPGTNLPIPSLTAKDALDLEFALSHGADAVALSFVRTADDMIDLRNRILMAGSRAITVAKIEKAEAVENLDAIIEASDAVMVARGDLGVEIGVSKVPLVQKRIIEQARLAGRAVITATQMLESMIEHPEPTRAEASDVANAIIDGTSAVMLSAETASGAHPLAAVRVMDTIAREVEPELPSLPGEQTSAELPAVLAASACAIADRIGAAAIVVPTESGATAREIVRSRPRRPIVAAASDPLVLRQLALEWGVSPILVPAAESAELLWAAIIDAICEAGLAGSGEMVVFAGRTELAMPGETTHVLVHRLAERPAG